MALQDRLLALKERTLADLNAAHDYYEGTILAWQIVRKAVAGGHTFKMRKRSTGTVTSPAQLAAKAPGYVARQLAEATFHQFIAIFESFFFDLLRLWLLAYPESLGGKKVDFKALLDAPDKEAVTLLVVNREVNEVLYERPAGWFAYLDGKVKLGCPTADEIERIAEAKATRDVFLHNRGIANRAYEAKAGPLARCKEGEPLEIPEKYHRETWELLRTVVTDVADAAIAKAA